MLPKFDVEVRFKISQTMLSRMNAILMAEELTPSEFGRRAFMEFIKRHEAELVSVFSMHDETDD
jgi:hypothetical protein